MKSVSKKSKIGTFGIVTKAVVFKGNKVLLLKRTNYDGGPAAGEWDIPGGKLEEGEEIEAALHREMFEEANIKGKIIMPFDKHDWYSKEEKMHKIAINFIVEYKSGTAKHSHEHEFAKWFDMSKIPAETTQWVKDVVKKAVRIRAAINHKNI